MEAVPRLPTLSFKLKTSPEGTSFVGLKKYIAETYDENPEQYSKEVLALETLRNRAMKPSKDVEGCATLKRYYCQLHSLASRFPNLSERNLFKFTWKDLYSNQISEVNDIRYEMASVLYNIGSMHTQLGSTVDRTEVEGMKLACTHFQCAAWAFGELKDKYSNIINHNTDSSNSANGPNDFMTTELLLFMQQISFAQAQECILEKSLIDNRKPSVVAKVTSQIINYYSSALVALLTGGDDGNIAELVDSNTYKEWKKYLRFKISYLNCILFLYQGQQAEEQKKMGERVVLYQAAWDKLEEARKESKGMTEFQKEIAETLTFTADVVEAKRKTAKNENEFIYHEKVPSLSDISAVKAANLVNGIGFSVTDPDVAGEDIFGRLVPMKAHEASSLYSEEKAKLLRKMGEKIEEKDQELNTYMSSLSTENLNISEERSNKIPQGIVDRCASLNSKPNAIPDLIASMSSLAEICADVETNLNEIKALLSDEDKNETQYQQKSGVRRSTMNPHFAELTREFQKYMEAHQKAGESNATLRRAMELHVNNLKILSRPLQDIQASVPKLTGDVNENAFHELKLLLNKVNEMKAQRAQFYADLRIAIKDDDITSKVIALDDEKDKKELFKKEIAKHDKICALIDKNLEAQENILSALTDAYAKCAPLLKTIADVKHKRENFFSSLAASYDVYEDLLGKSAKGLEFYKKLQGNVHKLLTRVRAARDVQDEERQQRMKPKPIRPAPVGSETPNYYTTKSSSELYSQVTMEVSSDVETSEVRHSDKNGYITPIYQNERSKSSLAYAQQQLVQQQQTEQLQQQQKKEQQQQQSVQQQLLMLQQQQQQMEQLKQQKQSDRHSQQSVQQQLLMLQQQQQQMEQLKQQKQSDRHSQQSVQQQLLMLQQQQQQMEQLKQQKQNERHQQLQLQQQQQLQLQQQQQGQLQQQQQGQLQQQQQAQLQQQQQGQLQQQQQVQLQQQQQAQLQQHQLQLQQQQQQQAQIQQQQQQQQVQMQQQQQLQMQRPEQQLQMQQSSQMNVILGQGQHSALSAAQQQGAYQQQQQSDLSSGVISHTKYQQPPMIRGVDIDMEKLSVQTPDENMSYGHYNMHPYQTVVGQTVPCAVPPMYGAQTCSYATHPGYVYNQSTGEYQYGSGYQVDANGQPCAYGQYTNAQANQPCYTTDSTNEGVGNIYGSAYQPCYTTGNNEGVGDIYQQSGSQPSYPANVSYYNVPYGYKSNTAQPQVYKNTAAFCESNVNVDTKNLQKGGGSTYVQSNNFNNTNTAASGNHVEPSVTTQQQHQHSLPQPHLQENSNQKQQQTKSVDNKTSVNIKKSQTKKSSSNIDLLSDVDFSLPASLPAPVLKPQPATITPSSSNSSIPQQQQQPEISNPQTEFISIPTTTTTTKTATATKHVRASSISSEPPNRSTLEIIFQSTDLNLNDQRKLSCDNLSICSDLSSLDQNFDWDSISVRSGGGGGLGQQSPLKYKSSSNDNITMKANDNKNPFDDARILKYFHKEIERYERIIENLNVKMLNGNTPLITKWNELQELLSKDDIKRTIIIGKLFPEKNRSNDSIPYDHARVILDRNTDDYINAAYVKDLGPECPTFILTQTPLQNTLNDFWFMVWSQKARTLVCLHTPNEILDTFWPQQINQEMHFDDISVTLIKQFDLSHCIEYHLKLTMNGADAILDLSLIQIKAWTKSSPSQVLGIADNILQVFKNKCKEFKSNTTPLIMNCLTGSERSGLVAVAICTILATQTRRPILINVIDLWYRICSQRKNALKDPINLQLSMQIVLCHGHNLLNKRGIMTSYQMKSAQIAANKEKDEIKDPLNDLDPLWKLK